MESLHDINEIWGHTTLIESDPGDETCLSAIYVPVSELTFFDADPQWGVYHRDGRLVEAAAYYRGPHKTLVGQSPITSLRGAKMDFIDEDMVYGGPVITHYGHFLTACLPRLWHISTTGGSRRRILCHGHEDPAGWFAHDFIRAILTALGLSAENFVRLASPSVIRRLWVPRPAMEEQNFVHRAFDDLGVTIGHFYGSHREPQSGAPIYLSKTRLATGISRFEQEQVLEDCFAARGFEIVHPQELSFSEQISAFARARFITGTAGSALHTSLFLDRPSRILALTVADVINSNFCLIDRLKGSEVRYLWPRTQVDSRSDEDSFQSTWIIGDMTRIAEELAAVADEFAAQS